MSDTIERGQAFSTEVLLLAASIGERPESDQVPRQVLRRFRSADIVVTFDDTRATSIKRLKLVDNTATGSRFLELTLRNRPSTLDDLDPQALFNINVILRHPVDSEPYRTWTMSHAGLQQTPRPGRPLLYVSTAVDQAFLTQERSRG